MSSQLIKNQLLTFALLLLVVISQGCTGPLPPRPNVQEAAAQVTGIENAISFQFVENKDPTPFPTSSVLTMQEAIRRALQTDPDVQAVLARVRAAEAEADQAALLPNPILRVALRFPESSGKPIIDAGLTEDFIALLTRPGRIEAADNRLRATAAEAITTVLGALAEVKERYTSVQSLDALMPVLEERRNLIAKLLKLAQDRLNNGEGTQLDITTLDTQRLELEVDIAEKKLERRRERLSLTRLIGRPTDAPDWQLSPWEVPPLQAASEMAWMETALTRRPEIESARWELAALGVEKRLTRFAPFDGADASIESERDSDWSVGPAINVPLPFFDWGQAKRAKASALRIEAVHKLTKSRRQVIEEVRKSYAEFDATRETLELVRAQLLPAQQQRRTQTEAAYKNGQTDITTLIIADQDLQATRTKLIELQQKTSSAQIRLERAVGGPGAADQVPTTRPSTAPATRPLMPTPVRP